MQRERKSNVHKAERTPDAHLIKAFYIGPEILPLCPAVVHREWMQNTASNFANRCLPLRIANQFGWFLINNDEIEVTWDGGQDQASLKIRRLGGRDYAPAASHFGYGIITWRVPYLFRTPPGYNLYVRGPTNFPKDGACPLDGIIETDWAVATFTMNWKITCIGVPVYFHVGEPIAMIQPVARGELEKFEFVIEDMNQEPRLQEQHSAWSMSRAEFNLNLMKSQCPHSWQKDYFFGRANEGPAFEGHQVSLQLKHVVNNTLLDNSLPVPDRFVAKCPDEGPVDRAQRKSILWRLAQRMKRRAEVLKTTRHLF